ncbi:hypothetical protein [Comamonas sp. JC664]
MQALIHADEPPRALPPRDGPFIKNRFRSALACSRSSHSRDAARHPF